MLKTIEQVANQLNVSKATIYNKIKLNRFKDMVVSKLGIAMLDDDSIQLIEADIKGNRIYKSNDNIESQQDAEEAITSSNRVIDDTYNQLNKDYIASLKDQLKEKDNQLYNFNERLKQEQDLNKNSQILLREKPHQDILLLEEHFQDLDTKLEEVKDNMLQRKDKQKQKSFLSKIFNSKG